VELHNLCSFPSTDKVMKSRWTLFGWTCITNCEKRHVYRVFLGKPVGKRTLGRPRHKLVHYIKMDHGEIMHCYELV
jgi:hypothetical protein